jgi:hypothetical protein
MSVFHRLRLPEDTVKAVRLLRVNGLIVVHDEFTEDMAAQDGADASKFCAPGNGVPKNSYIVQLIGEDVVSIISRTMRGGKVAHNFECVVTRAGTLLTGSVDTGAYGEEPMDQEFIDELFSNPPPRWDFLERGQYEESESE